MLKKSLLSLAITASVAGLSGCDISSTTANDGALSDSQEINDAAQAAAATLREGRVAPYFDVLNSVVPLGSDLVFASAAATDGTANVGADGGNPVLSALNDLDGGISTLAPIDLVMDGSLDATTVAANVFLVKLPNRADAENLTVPTTVEYTDELGATQEKAFTINDIDALDITTLSPLVTATNMAAIIGMQPVAGTDYEVSAITLNSVTDNTIRITPLLPLDAKSKYIAVVTKGVMDLNGEALLESENYEYVSDADPIFSSSLAPVQAATRGWEALATAILATAGKNVSAGYAIASAYTTVDPKTVLKSMAYPGYWAESAIVGNNATAAAGIIAQAAAATVEAGGDDPTATYAGMVTVAQGNGLTEDEANIFVAGYLASAAYVQPYLSTPQARSYEFINAELANGVSTDQLPFVALNAASAAAGGTSVLISQGAIELPQYTTSLAVNANSAWEANVAVGAALDVVQGNAAGTTPPKDVEGDTNVTYRYPFAEQQRTTVVPVLFVEPTDTAKATAYAAFGATDSGCTKGANGWPVVIAQHGITVNRAGTLLTATALANSTCSVVVAMDLPHHGIAPQTTDRDGTDIDSSSRAFTTTYNDFTSSVTASEYSPWAVGAKALADASEDSILNNLAERHEELYLTPLQQTVPMTYDADAGLGGQSGDFYIRLTNFQRARDNNRQAVMDLLNLNATLSTIDIDGVAGADLDTSQVTFVGHSLGGIVGATFAAVNNDKTVQLASKLVGQLTQTGAVVLPKITEVVLATPGGGIAKLLESSVSIGTSIKAGLLAASQIAPGDGDFESYMTVLQATLDSADPMNFISDLAAGGVSETPVMLIEMVGGATIDDGTTVVANVGLPSAYLDVATAYPADYVVPNNTSANTDETAQVTLAGTDPMITLIDSVTSDNHIPSTASTTTATNYPVTKFTAGTHGTFSSADAPIAFSEMMAETASFILTSGASVTTSAASPLVLDNSAD